MGVQSSRSRVAQSWRKDSVLARQVCHQRGSREPSAAEAPILTSIPGIGRRSRDRHWDIAEYRQHSIAKDVFRKCDLRSVEALAEAGGQWARLACGSGAKRSQLKEESAFDLDRHTNQSLCAQRTLPPFGLVYVWRYYKQSDPVSQRIASIALVLTILMTAASLWITIDTLNAVNRMLNAALNGSID